MRNGDRSNVSSMCMPMGNANCLTNHRAVTLARHLCVGANFGDDILTLLVGCCVHHRLSVGRTLLLLVASLLLHCLANLLRHVLDHSGALRHAVSGASLLRHHVVCQLAVRDRVMICPRVTVSSPMSIAVAVPRVSFSISVRFSLSNRRRDRRRHDQQNYKM